MSDALLPPQGHWAILRAATPARIGLARAGCALTTRDVLAFDLAHARARDAVDTALDLSALTADLAPLIVTHVHSAARDRPSFLRRPDLGRRLNADGAARLHGGPYDLALVIADGLSGSAVQRHAPAVVRQILRRAQDYSIAPPVVAEQARVALGDDIAMRLKARAVAVLIGERPGLSMHDSLGIYLTLHPSATCTDADRNCISNIHGAGLSPEEAASKLVWLLREAFRRGLSGVGLKDQALLEQSEVFGTQP